MIGAASPFRRRYHSARACRRCATKTSRSARQNGNDIDEQKSFLRASGGVFWSVRRGLIILCGGSYANLHHSAPLDTSRTAEHQRKPLAAQRCPEGIPGGRRKDERLLHGDRSVRLRRDQRST